jgi:D-tyrosyl-tRNA(Tyr) deacylase
MIGLIQRVRSAAVDIDGRTVARCGPGMLVLVGFRRDDDSDRLDRFVERLLNYRMFADDAGRMNRSLRDIDGGLLAVPQFTLAADTHAGNRPSFSPAAPAERGKALFDGFRDRLRAAWPDAGFGEFGADMQVSLVNDGPVTFWLEV